MRYIFIITLLLATIACSKKSPLQNALSSDKEIIKKVMSDPEGFEVQVLFTQIDRDKNGAPSFTDYEYQVNDSIYFYPASTVKFPIAVLALEKLKELQDRGTPIDKETFFITQNDTLYSTIAKEITKIFAVSDNGAYNRLFEFLGQDYINKKLKSKKITGSISHRLSAFHSHNPQTQSLIFKSAPQDSTILYRQEGIKNKILPKLNLKKVLKGDGYIYRDTLLQKPKDFSEKNHLPITSLHEMMKRLHFPENFEFSERFNLQDKDHQFIIKTMNILPYEAGYDQEKYYHSYGKFFMFGDKKEKIPGHFKIYNKVGYAYGYLTDCAYIKDTQNDIEFILTATIHVNQNRIYNDNNYEYDEIGIPFLAELGRQLYEQEKHRKK